MRWFKCDLQVQTPADRVNWRGAVMSDTDEARRDAAETYIRRCYEAGLEVIAVTDHNFLSKDFIPCLRDAINRVAHQYGYRLILFPGFECEAEALRQAFLDHPSRIRLPEDAATDVNPGNRQHHARILSLEVADTAFMADQRLEFSPNVNCIIGGRGSGKSTLIEYLRLCMGKDNDEDVRSDERTRDKVARIRSTIDDVMGVSVSWRNRDGVEDTLVLNPRSDSPEVQGRNLIDPDAFFRSRPARFFSQQQITHFTDQGSNNLLLLIDEFVRDDMTALDASERETRRLLEHLFQIKRDHAALWVDLKRVEQELAELTRQWSARHGLQSAAKAHQALQEEAHYVERVRGEWSAPVQWVDLADDFAESHSPLGSAADHWPHGVWLRELDSKIDTAKSDLLQGIKESVEKFQQTLSDLFNADPDWPGINTALTSATEVFGQACQAQGLTPEEVNRAQEIGRLRAAKQTEKEAKVAQLAALDVQLESLGDTLARLHKLWRKQWRLRLDAAHQAQAVGLSLHQKFIEVSVVFGGDQDGFRAIWGRVRPRDGRNRLARNWEEIGDALFKQCQDLGADSVWTPVDAILDGKTPPTPALIEWQSELAQHLCSPDVAPVWDNVRLSRVPDLVDLTLYRADGTRAGSVLKGDLSDGQRNTAALALLLAQGDGPLIIDQPEDELDSSFIYRDMIPMLRQIKERRQLIFATHNANLPVNGDAELVYALEAQGGRGRVLAQGGLDRRDVTTAVLEIMEGSEEAFIKRRNKCHF